MRNVNKQELLDMLTQRAIKVHVQIDALRGDMRRMESKKEVKARLAEIRHMHVAVTLMGTGFRLDDITDGKLIIKPDTPKVKDQKLLGNLDHAMAGIANLAVTHKLRVEVRNGYHKLLDTVTEQTKLTDKQKLLTTNI